jgi:hypothetical protein
MSYLLVDDRDGRILGEFDFLEDALTMMERLREEGPPERDVFLARFDDRPGEVVGTKSVVTVRIGR